MQSARQSQSGMEFLGKGNAPKTRLGVTREPLLRTPYELLLSEEIGGAECKLVGASRSEGLVAESSN